MGNINITTARTKAYANEQRTMSTEHYSKQTQSNPIGAESHYHNAVAGIRQAVEENRRQKCSGANEQPAENQARQECKG